MLHLHPRACLAPWHPLVALAACHRPRLLAEEGPRMSAEASTPTNNSNTRLSRIIAAGFGIPTAHKDRNPAAHVRTALRGLQTENAFEEMHCGDARCPSLVFSSSSHAATRAEEAAVRGELLLRRRQGMVGSSSATSDPRADPVVPPPSPLPSWKRAWTPHGWAARQRLS